MDLLKYSRATYAQCKRKVIKMKVEQNKPHSIHLRLTDEQYGYCQLNAELMGVSVSDFIRMMINSLLVSTEKFKGVTLGDLGHANKKDDK